MRAGTGVPATVGGLDEVGAFEVRRSMRAGTGVPATAGPARLPHV